MIGLVIFVLFFWSSSLLSSFLLFLIKMGL